MTSEREMEAIFEAVLFVTPEPVQPNKLLSLFPDREQEQAAAALERVLERYRLPEETDEESDRGVMLDEVAGGVRLVTRPELHGFLRRFFEISGSNKLTMAGLETLAIIAYRQPITAPEIQELRGKNSSGVVKTLLERRMIRISGRKEVVGKPFMYSTTRDFLLHFGLSNLKDLPPLEEFEETFLSEGGSLEPDPEEEALQQLALVEDAEAEEDDPEDATESETPGPAASQETAAEEGGDEPAASGADPLGDEAPDDEAPEKGVGEDEAVVGGTVAEEAEATEAAALEEESGRVLEMPGVQSPSDEEE
ncbi:MAG: SMC-Scp complex subunit ScpB [Acidobacteriota bacterium]